MKKDNRATVKISSELKKELKKISAEKDSSIQSLVESALREKYKI